MKTLKTWILPIIIAGIMFFAVRPVFAQITSVQVPENVQVGIEVVDGFSQVYYLANDQKIFVNKNSQNKKHPHSNGGYIVWVAEINDSPGQIFLYDISTDTTIQITNSSTNLNPKVSKDGKIVWERLVEDRWQVVLFDGKSTGILTEGDTSFNPNIEGDFITYARQDVTGSYRSVVYLISKKESKDIAMGISSKNPSVKDGKISLNGDSFPLTVSDLFLLDLPSLTSGSIVNVTEEDIIQELEEVPLASESGTVAGSEAEATPTATPIASPTPEPTPEVTPTVIPTPVSTDQ